jgi:hypothetical protein
VSGIQWSSPDQRKLGELPHAYYCNFPTPPGLLQDGDVGVGVFPEREEIFVGGEGSNAGRIGIRALRSSRLQSVCTGHAQMRQRSRPAVPDDPAVVENLLKLGGGRSAVSG